MKTIGNIIYGRMHLSRWIRPALHRYGMLMFDSTAVMEVKEECR